ncbi:MAG: tetratricopeptide repeat protein [bacterium]
MRFKILTKLESEAIDFAKCCSDHGNKNDARKVLQKVLKIIPDCEEAKRLLNSPIVG